MELTSAGTSWVAEDCGGTLIGFLCAELTGDALHIWELAVTPDHQLKGIGRALLEEAIGFARHRRLASLTLTTFRSVPWNEPIYHKIGFVTLRSEDCGDSLDELLDREAATGLPRARRCAMRMALSAATGR